MNTAQDRANRISSWSARARDLLWIMTTVIISHLVLITIIGFELTNAFIPASVFLVFMTAMGILGSLDAMDDIAVQADDADDEEKQTKGSKKIPYLEPFIEIMKGGKNPFLLDDLTDKNYQG